MSFFDEADGPPTAPHRPRRPPRRSRTDRQAIQMRRAVAAAVLLVLVILAAVGISSCETSQRNSALRSYTDNVATLIQQSDQTGQNLFSILSGGGASGNAGRLQTEIDNARLSAQGQLSRAKGLDVPDQMQPAQRDLVRLMQMRRDGIGDIGMNIQQALGRSTPRDALTAIAGDMARFYASDVLYKDYVAPEIAGALHAAGLPVGGQNGETIDPGQFLPDLGWLTPAFIAGKLQVQAPPGTTGASKPAAPGIHGHALSSVSANGTTLQQGVTNTLPASPPPTFTVNFTNDGTDTETNVVVRVSVSGTSVAAQTVVPQTTPGQPATAQVTLPSSPPPGTYTVTATIERVPGEKTVVHNTQSFQVAFH